MLKDLYNDAINACADANALDMNESTAPLKSAAALYASSVYTYLTTYDEYTLANYGLYNGHLERLAIDSSLLDIESFNYQMQLTF